MKLEDFKINEQWFKAEIIQENKIEKKIKIALDYLINHLPINKLTKLNTFNFNKLKFDEGKNYNWYFLNNNKTSKLLVRQYGTHFTFFSSFKPKDGYKTTISIFTIYDNRDKMDGNTSDSYLDDNFQSITNYLPNLIKMIEAEKLHSIWNNLSFPRPKHCEVKIAMIGNENIQSLDTIIFACDELFDKYICVYAENEVLDLIKKYEVGDMFGSAYKITKIKTNLKDGYYHGVGLEFINTNFKDSKPEWSDVYSLVMHHSNCLFYEDEVFENEVNEFLYKNHNKIMNILIEGEQNPYRGMFIDGDYIKEAIKLYGDVDEVKFHRAVGKEYRDFIKMSYRITQI